MSAYISCNLTGGLGNQLFQIFTTIAVGIENRRKIVFPYYETSPVGKPRPTYWNNFLISLKIMTNENNRFGLSNQDLYKLPGVKEPAFHYTRIDPFDIRQGAMLHGYYQSHMYFENYKETIFKLIRLREQQNDMIEKYAALFSTDANTISMHFRLGDYKSLQDCHPLIGLDYYDSALGCLIEKRTSQDRDRKFRVLYFCEAEDNEVVSEMIGRLKSKYGSVEFEKVADDAKDWEQVLLMSCCDDNIIANSTFSWWGAYFNKNNKPIVCYPSVWFGEKLRHNTSDLFPKEWIQQVPLKN
jgi:hypothetical protein